MKWSVYLVFKWVNTAKFVKSTFFCRKTVIMNGTILSLNIMKLTQLETQKIGGKVGVLGILNLDFLSLADKKKIIQLPYNFVRS